MPLSSLPPPSPGLPGSTDSPSPADLSPARARCRTGLIKRFLPQTLFGRSLVIIVTPVVLAQLVAAWIFYDRHWQTITRRLVFAVVGEISLVIDQLERSGPATSPGPDGDAHAEAARAEVLAAAARYVDLLIEHRRDRRLPTPVHQPQGLIVEVLARGLGERIGRPFAISVHNSAEVYQIEIELADGTLQVLCPQRRLFSPTAHIFILWMVGSALILFAIALVFMRNQIRPIRRLAAAAESFGKGRDVMEFRLEGAREVRQAAQAFLDMRDRIRRQINQRTAMLAGVSHDLRTPLTRMKLQLALLAPSPDIEELKRDVAEMEAMVEGYLAFARGEAREPIKVTDLSRLVGEVVADARRAGGNVAFTTQEDLHLPLRVNAFRRCLTNLLSNARRHATGTWVDCRRLGAGDGERERDEDGGRDASASAVGNGGEADSARFKDRFEDEEAIQITVDDDGPGIPAAAREEVFKPFFRLDSSRNVETGGAGLGLTIARDVARSLGGDLWLATSPQGGLRAIIRLPV